MASDGETPGGIRIQRRTLLGAAIAAGVLGPLLGRGTASASDSDWYPIPEECGSVAWW